MSPSLVMEGMWPQALVSLVQEGSLAGCLHAWKGVETHDTTAKCV